MIVPTLSTTTIKASLITATGPIGALLIAIGNMLAAFEGFDATVIAGAITTIGFALWGVVIIGYGRWHRQRVRALAQYEEAFKASLQGQLETAKADVKKLRADVEALRKENRRLTTQIEVLDHQLHVRNASAPGDRRDRPAQG